MKNLILSLSALIALTACGAQTPRQIQTIPTSFPAQAVQAEVLTYSGESVDADTFILRVSSTIPNEENSVALVLEGELPFTFKETSPTGSKQRCIFKGGSAQKTIVCAWPDGLEIIVSNPGPVYALTVQGDNVVTKRYQLK